MDRTLQNLKRRLEAAELNHLREHANELNGRLEQAIERAEFAESWAENWQSTCMQLQEDMADELKAAGKSIGMTQDGAIGIVDTRPTLPPMPNTAYADLLDAAMAMRNYLLCRSGYDVQLNLDGERWDALNRAIEAVESQS